MQRSVEKILTTHIGSLGRSEQMLSLLGSRNKGDATDDVAFEGAVRDAVFAVVQRQAELGLDIINDGEQSKFSYQSYYRDRFSGYEPREAPATPARIPIAAEAADYPAFYERNYATRASAIRSYACTSAISYRDVEALHRDITNLRTAAEHHPHADLFMTAISPGMMKAVPNEFYADPHDYHHALCDAIRTEYQAIVEAGIILQIDCPDLGIFPRINDVDLAAYRNEIAANLELLNYATRDLDPQRMRIHVCCGADEAPHHRDGDLASILDLLLTARPAGLTLVGANGRHEHEWAVWRECSLPEGKVIIPGVIDNTTNIIEHPATVADRIVRYTEVLGRENVIAGVDCGFETIAGVAAMRVDPDIAWAKLGALVDGARIASERIWG